jgi:hypothetical protein
MQWRLRRGGRSDRRARVRGRVLAAELGRGWMQAGRWAWAREGVRVLVPGQAGRGGRRVRARLWALAGAVDKKKEKQQKAKAQQRMLERKNGKLEKIVQKLKGQLKASGKSGKGGAGSGESRSGKGGKGDKGSKGGKGGKGDKGGKGGKGGGGGNNKGWTRDPR